MRLAVRLAVSTTWRMQSTGESKTLGVSLIGEVALQWVAPATCTKIGKSKKIPHPLLSRLWRKRILILRMVKKIA